MPATDLAMWKIELDSCPITLGAVDLNMSMKNRLRAEKGEVIRIWRKVQRVGLEFVVRCWRLIKQSSCTCFASFTCPQKRKRPLQFLPDGPRDGSDTYTRSPSCMLAI